MHSGLLPLYACLHLNQALPQFWRQGRNTGPRGFAENIQRFGQAFLKSKALRLDLNGVCRNESRIQGVKA